MKETAEALAGILEKQIRNYAELKRLALEKRSALSAHDLRKLAKATADIQTVTASNYALEEERSDLASQLAAEVGLGEENPTLSQIAGRIDSPLRERLHFLKDQAAAAIRDVQHQNRMNTEMLKYCANLMDSAVKGLLEPKLKQNTYGSTGTANRDVASAVLLDHHI